MAALRGSMHELGGLDDLGFLNIGAALTSAANFAKAAVPKLAESAINRKLSKDAAKAAKNQAQTVALKTATAAAVAPVAAAAAAPAPASVNWASFAKPAAVVGGVVAAVVVVASVMRKGKQ